MVERRCQSPKRKAKNRSIKPNKVNLNPFVQTLFWSVKQRALALNYKPAKRIAPARTVGS
jgi:hypothetical protein